MAPTKSIYRGPNSQHFQLVHRSQRDPLIHDPEASQHVLKPFARENEAKKGKTRADLESSLSPAEVAFHKERGNIGEAATYGIYYDDTEYDYMQHLRDSNLQEEGMETIMIDAPVKVKGKGKGSHEDIAFHLPSEALPSISELDTKQVYDSLQAIPQAISGFQPDMDPHLRQTLEALEEDAFVEDTLDDDFFQELVKDGQRISDEEIEFEFKEEGVNEGQKHADNDTETDHSWQARFARFKKQQKEELSEEEDASSAGGAELDGLSEVADTVSRLPVIGGKRRRKGAATASSGFSMTSSAVYRNAGLSLLDERYEQFEKAYDDDEDDMPPDPEFIDSDEEPDEAPDLIAARDDFEAVMNDFLENYELVGRRMAPVLPGATAVEKLDTIRRGLGDVRLNTDEEEDDDGYIPMPEDVDNKKEKWDCETILTTYSNVENHPRLINARESKPTPRIRLDPKTGMPITEAPKAFSQQDGVSNDEGEEDSDDTVGKSAKVTVTRQRDESKEAKRARKQAVKQERQTRRQDKKATREHFSAERKQMVRVIAKREPGVMKKL